MKETKGEAVRGMFRGEKSKPADFMPPVLFLLFGILLIFLIFQVFRSPYMTQRVTDISDRWQYYTDADPTPRPIRLPSGTKGIYLNENWYLTYTLPDIGSNAAIMFRSDYLRVIAELDGEEIYSFGYENSVFDAPGKMLVLIPLPEGYASKEITLTLTPTMNLRAYGIYMGDEASLLSGAVGDMLPALVLGVAVFLLGLGLLGLYFIQRKNGKVALPDFWFGVFVILVGAFIPSKSFLLLMLLDPITASVLPLLVSFLLPCSILLFIRASSQKFKVPLLVALIIHIAGFLPASLMQLLTPNPPTEVLAFFVYLIPCYYALAVLALVREVHAGKKEYRRLLIFALLIIAMMIADKVNSVLGNPLHFNDVEQLTKLGLIFFIVVEVVERIRGGIRSSGQLVADYQTAQVKSRLALEHFIDVKHYMEEVYTINHDIHHHFRALGHMLEQEDLPRAREYLSRLTGNYPLDRQIVYSENQLLNYIISYTVRQVKASGIRFTYAVDLPEKLSISDSDFYSLFINIVDNAVEASQAVKDVDNRRIELFCNMKNGFMHISCKNTKENAVVLKDRKYISTKSSDTKHGLGLGIIERIVDKYNGVMDIEYDAGSFTIKLVVKAE